MKKSDLHILCNKFGVDYKKAYSHKKAHPELADEQVIIYYRPDCYINILGEIVDPNNI